VTVRNQNVTNKLYETYRPTVQHVSCVGNAMYQEHRRGALRWLELSGIVALRLFCLGLVADHLLQDAKAFMSDTIPNLVSSVHLWVMSGSERIASETRAQIREVSRSVEQDLRSVSRFFQSKRTQSC
jgi:hypothetical protein